MFTTLVRGENPSVYISDNMTIRYYMYILPLQFSSYTFQAHYSIKTQSKPRAINKKKIFYLHSSDDIFFFLQPLRVYIVYGYNMYIRMKFCNSYFLGHHKNGGGRKKKLNFVFKGHPNVYTN